MKKVIIALFCFLWAFAIPMRVFASNDDNSPSEPSNVTITVVVPQTETQTQTPAIPVKPSYPPLYPINVWETQEGGRREIIKVYELSSSEMPEAIPRESFERGGYLYELSDITKKETAYADTKEESQTVTLDTDTKDTDAIIKLLAPTKEYRSEDGYIGVLNLDVSSIKVQTAGTKTSNYTVSATREYPHLSSNDTSLVPKTITDNGRTLTLANVTWKQQTSATVDYDQLPNSYTAVASYTANASKTTVTGYTTTAVYRGNVSKINTGKTIYTACFIGTKIMQYKIDYLPTKTEEPIETECDLVTETTESNKAEQDKETRPAKTDLSEETTQGSLSEPETELAEQSTQQPTTETKPLNKPSNTVPLVISIIAVMGLAGGFLYFYYQRQQKKKKESETL